MTDRRFELRKAQNVRDCTIEYVVTVPERFLMEMPRSLRHFEGWFNYQHISLEAKPQQGDSTETVIEDWILMNPEGLAMQLLRLAYLVALSEEGAYGEKDSSHEVVSAASPHASVPPLR